MRPNSVDWKKQKRRYACLLGVGVVAIFLDHETQCIVRNCKCYGRKHLLLRRAGPRSSYVRDLRPDENPAG